MPSRDGENDENDVEICRAVSEISEHIILTLAALAALSE